MVREQLVLGLARAVERARDAGLVSLAEAPGAQLQVPPSPELGDYSSDLALVLARHARRTPAELAQSLAGYLDLPANLVRRVEVAPSGFLNFHLQPHWLRDGLQAALEQDEEFGRSQDLGAGSAVQVEFVSADPTAPLTLMHGRGAALGDGIARLLEWSGFRVTREYYINDAGSQVERFARTLEARYLQALGRQDVPLPADAFPGAYVAELAQRIRSRAGEDYLALPPGQRRQVLSRQGIDTMIAEQRRTLTRFGVRFDEWSSERALEESGKVGALLDSLRASGQAYENDGALWLRTTAFGDSEDRPILRSNGRHTYIAGDLAYHLDKFRRGFDRVIDVWGPEHAPYVERTLAGMQSLGPAAGALEIRIFQPVSLLLDGLSSGSTILLEEVLDSVDRETARFFYLSRPADAALHFDLDLARREDGENPAFRVREACERAWRLAGDTRRVPGAAPDASALDPEALVRPAARALLRKLVDFPDEVRAACREREPYRITRYLLETAEAFEAFHPEGEPADAALLRASGIVLRNGLSVLGMTS